MQGWKRFFIFLLLCSTGCAWWKGSPGPADRDAPSRTAQVIDAERLAKGGSFVVIPFTAGANVEVTEELEDAALMLVKGFYEAFEGRETSLRLVTTDNPHPAQLILKGHIVKFGGGPVKGIQRWWRPPQKPSLGIEGQMIDMETGKVIIHFSDFRTAPDPKTNRRQLGYAMGAAMAEAVLLGAGP